MSDGFSTRRTERNKRAASTLFAGVVASRVHGAASRAALDHGRRRAGATAVEHVRIAIDLVATAVRSTGDARSRRGAHVVSSRRRNDATLGAASDDRSRAVSLAPIENRRLAHEPIPAAIEATLHAGYACVGSIGIGRRCDVVEAPACERGEGDEGDCTHGRKRMAWWESSHLQSAVRTNLALGLDVPTRFGNSLRTSTSLLSSRLAWSEASRAVRFSVPC